MEYARDLRTGKNRLSVEPRKLQHGGHREHRVEACSHLSPNGSFRRLTLFQGLKAHGRTSQMSELKLRPPKEDWKQTSLIGIAAKHGPGLGGLAGLAGIEVESTIGIRLRCVPERLGLSGLS